MASRNLNYTRGVVIVHGKSEYQFVRFIYTNLHLQIKIIAKDKGKHSIQINGLLNCLKKEFGNSMKKFAEKYGIEYDKKNKKYPNFKLFIIMDTDDCDEKTKNSYISGDLFKGHPLHPYIIPIYNIQNLEDIMMKAKIMPKRISNSEKGTYYTKIFPMGKNTTDLNEIREFSKKIKNIKDTNMLEFIKYCFELIGEDLWKDDN